MFSGNRTVRTGPVGQGGTLTVFLDWIFKNIFSCVLKAVCLN